MTLRPKPWWNPSRAKFALKRASGAAMRKSAERARPRPPPIAAPCTAATTGVCGAEDPHGGRVQVVGRVRAVALGEVGAGTEVFAGGTEHRGPTPVVAIEQLEGVGHAADLVEREEVVRRVGQLDRRARSRRRPGP